MGLRTFVRNNRNLLLFDVIYSASAISSFYFQNAYIFAATSFSTPLILLANYTDEMRMGKLWRY